jgi:hypothetical protein
MLEVLHLTLTIYEFHKQVWHFVQIVTIEVANFRLATHGSENLAVKSVHYALVKHLVVKGCD